MFLNRNQSRSGLDIGVYMDVLIVLLFRNVISITINYDRHFVARFLSTISTSHIINDFTRCVLCNMNYIYKTAIIAVIICYVVVNTMHSWRLNCFSMKLLVAHSALIKYENDVHYTNLVSQTSKIFILTVVVFAHH